MSEAVVVDVVRIASGRGKPGGALSGTHPATLLSHVLSALGHAPGSSGTRLLGTLLNHLETTGGRYGGRAETTKNEVS